MHRILPLQTKRPAMKLSFSAPSKFTTSDLLATLVRQPANMTYCIPFLRFNLLATSAFFHIHIIKQEADSSAI